MKNNGKSFGKGKFSSFKNYKKDFKKKDVRESSPPQGIVCYECNGHGHLKECLNYLRGKGKELTSTLVIWRAQTHVLKKDVMVMATTLRLWQLPWLIQKKN